VRAKPILGEGDHKYECTHNRGEVPANIDSAGLAGEDSGQG